ncbi:unnamed protein product [Closterium sp. Naga37s-1]|nr:unnamed protein product [Closterium sp. Naga37s-1]
MQHCLPQQIVPSSRPSRSTLGQHSMAPTVPSADAAPQHLGLVRGLQQVEPQQWLRSLGQHWSPQHLVSGGQHLFPQHSCPALQHCAPQHVSPVGTPVVGFTCGQHVPPRVVPWMLQQRDLDARSQQVRPPQHLVPPMQHADPQHSLPVSFPSTFSMGQQSIAGGVPVVEREELPQHCGLSFLSQHLLGPQHWNPGLQHVAPQQSPSSGQHLPPPQHWVPLGQHVPSAQQLSPTLQHCTPATSCLGFLASMPTDRPSMAMANSLALPATSMVGLQQNVSAGQHLPSPQHTVPFLQHVLPSWQHWLPSGQQVSVGVPSLSVQHVSLLRQHLRPQHWLPVAAPVEVAAGQQAPCSSTHCPSPQHSYPGLQQVDPQHWVPSGQHCPAQHSPGLRSYPTQHCARTFGSQHVLPQHVDCMPVDVCIIGQHLPSPQHCVPAGQHSLPQHIVPSLQHLPLPQHLVPFSQHVLPSSQHDAPSGQQRLSGFPRGSWQHTEPPLQHAVPQHRSPVDVPSAVTPGQHVPSAPMISDGPGFPGFAAAGSSALRSAVPVVTTCVQHCGWSLVSQHWPLQQEKPGLQHLPPQHAAPTGQHWPPQHSAPCSQHLPLQQRCPRAQHALPSQQPVPSGQQLAPQHSPLQHCAFNLVVPQHLLACAQHFPPQQRPSWLRQHSPKMAGLSLKGVQHDTPNSSPPRQHLPPQHLGPT